MTVSKIKLFRALILLPGNAMVLVPGALLYLEGKITPAFGTTGILRAVILLIAFWFMFFEEKGLEKRFGQPYLEYKKRVPRWIPRLTPYEAPSTSPG